MNTHENEVWETASPNAMRSFLKLTITATILGTCSICYLTMLPTGKPRFSSSEVLQPISQIDYPMQAWASRHANTSSSFYDFQKPQFPPMQELRAKNQAEWRIADELKQEIVVDHWVDCGIEAEWEAPKAVHAPDALKVIGVSIDNQHYAFARAGMLNLHHSIYEFTIDAVQCIVTHWGSKNRTRVFLANSDCPAEFGIAGVTREVELVLSANGECLQHGGEIPLKEIEFEVTDLADWLTRHPSTHFCATNLSMGVVH